MKGLKLEHLLLEPLEQRWVTSEPAMNHAQLWEQSLSLAAGLQAHGVQRLAVHLEDAGLLAIALLGAWRAGVSVLLPADLQPQTRQRWNIAVDAWLTEAADFDALYQAPLSGAPLDLDACQLSLCTSGSSGEPKRIDKSRRQLAEGRAHHGFGPGRTHLGVLVDLVTRMQARQPVVVAAFGVGGQGGGGVRRSC